MEESLIFKQTGTYDNRKELLIHYLKLLHDQNMPITFSDLISKCLPGGGLPEFESVMIELESRKWIIKTEKPGSPVQGLPFYHIVDRRFSISLEGVEYLASLGIIEDKHKTKFGTEKHHINNYGNLVLGDNPQGINQDFEGGNQWSNNNSTIREPAIVKEQPIETSDKSLKSKISIWNKIYKWTDHKLISIIIFSILGFLIARLFAHFSWFN